MVASIEFLAPFKWPKTLTLSPILNLLNDESKYGRYPKNANKFVGVFWAG